jgi:predicted Zn-dependent peptidase
MKFRDERFVSQNLTISFSGVPHETAVALTECYFLNLKSGQPILDSSTPLYIGGSLRVKANMNGATYAGLAFPTDGKDGENMFSS